MEIGFWVSDKGISLALGRAEGQAGLVLRTFQRDVKLVLILLIPCHPVSKVAAVGLSSPNTTTAQ